MVATENGCNSVLKDKQSHHFRETAAIHSKLHANHGNFDLLRRNISVLRNNSANLGDIDYNGVAIHSKSDLFASLNRKALYLNRQCSTDGTRANDDFQKSCDETSKSRQYYSDDNEHLDSSFDKIDVEYEEENTNNDANLSDTKSVHSNSTLNDRAHQSGSSKTEYPSDWTDKSDDKLLLKLYSHQNNKANRSTRLSDYLAEEDSLRAKQSSDWSSGLSSKQSDTKACLDSGSRDYDLDLRKKMTNIRNTKYFSIDSLIGRAMSSDIS